MICCGRRCRKSPEVSTKILIVFDFDKTIIDVNGDDYILQLLPDRGQELHKLQATMPWTDYMQNVLQELHTNGKNIEDLKKCVQELPYTAGMKELITELKQMDHEIIIISDSNSFFIERSLLEAGIYEDISKIFTNPAEIDGKGCLRISMYHHQDTCLLCPINLCKGDILDQYIRRRLKDGQIFQFIVYVADGSTDYCPTLRLRQNDFVFPRANYPLHDILKSEGENSANKTKATIIPWDSAFQIKEKIVQIINS